MTLFNKNNIFNYKKQNLGNTFITFTTLFNVKLKWYMNYYAENKQSIKFYSQKSIINEHKNHFKSIISFSNILKIIEQKEKQNPGLKKCEIEKIIFNLLVDNKKTGVFIAKTTPDLILSKIVSGRLNSNCFNWEIYKTLIDTCNSKEYKQSPLSKHFLKDLPKLNEIYKDIIYFRVKLFKKLKFSSRNKVNLYFLQTSVAKILEDFDNFLFDQKLPSFFL